MFKDRYFYPMAAIVIAAMINFALSFGERIDLTEHEILKNGYVMKGEELARLMAQPGTQSVFVSAAAGEPAYATLTSTAARDSIDPGPGIFAPLGPEYERAFASRRLRMTITARPSRLNPLEKFDMAYFTGSIDSGWKPRQLKPGWSDYVMEFRPSAEAQKQGVDYFSIWPGETAELLNMDIKEMRVEVLDPPS